MQERVLEDGARRRVGPLDEGRTPPTIPLVAPFACPPRDPSVPPRKAVANRVPPPRDGGRPTAGA
jgi:hypothetical protein